MVVSPPWEIWSYTVKGLGNGLAQDGSYPVTNAETELVYFSAVVSRFRFRLRLQKASTETLLFSLLSFSSFLSLPPSRSRLFLVLSLGLSPLHSPLFSFLTTSDETKNKTKVDSKQPTWLTSPVDSVTRDVEDNGFVSSHCLCLSATTLMFSTYKHDRGSCAVAQSHKSN